jgi:hypothetical protein
MINVSSNKQCITISKNTIAPITYVPYIILYFNGKPYMVYKGPYDANEIRRFVLEVAGNLQKKQKFAEAPKQVQKGGHKKTIPDYTVGIPVYGQGNAVTYLDFEIAYPDEKKY